MKWYDVVATLVSFAIVVAIYLVATRDPSNVFIGTYECEPDVCVVYAPHYKTTVHPDVLHRYLNQVAQDCAVEGHRVVWVEN